MPARLQILYISNGSRVTQRGEVSLLDPHPPVVTEQAWFRQGPGERGWFSRWWSLAATRGGTGRVVAAPLDCFAAPLYSWFLA